jgi:cytochrome bd-type quinol oxidase subunit 2
MSNPDLAIGGIVVGLMIGLGVGALLNGIIFKKKDSDEINDLENK